MNLDAVFNPTRLSICAYLSGARQADFTAVQEYCGISKPTLSKALTALDERGYVLIGKVPSGRYTKTVLSLTDSGRAALDEYLQVLQRIAREGQESQEARDSREVRESREGVAGPAA